LRAVLAEDLFEIFIEICGRKIYRGRDLCQDKIEIFSADTKTKPNSKTLQVMNRFFI